MPENHRGSGSRTTAALLSSLLAVVLAVTTLGTATPADAAAIKTARLRYSAAIEPLAGYQAQMTCSPIAKPGVTDFSRRLLRAFPTTRSLGIVRACSAGGRSEHKEGRAFDWGVTVRSAADRKRVAAVMTWLLKTDRFGNRYAMARRLGIQYMIWNRRIWGSYAADSGWRRYRGASPHTDHVHFSFTWAGARARTSFWTGKVGNINAAPSPTRPPVTPPPVTPKPTTTPLPRPTSTPPPTTSTPRPTTTRPTIPPARPAPVPPGSLLDGPPLEDETVVVDAVTGAATTTGALQEGQRYLLESTGTYRYGPSADQLADAECSRTATDSSWRRDRSVHVLQPWSDHLDLYLDGEDLAASPDVNGGDSCDTRTHTYRQTVEAERTGRVTLQLWDPTTADDNAGSVTVRLIALRPREDMEWLLPASAGAGVMSPGALEAGFRHLVTVSGTVDAGNGVVADAVCSVSATDPVWRPVRSVLDGSSGSDHLNVLVNRSTVTLRPVVDPDGDGCDTDTHTYRYDRGSSSTTAAINVRVNDPVWADNSGALTVRAQRVEPVVDTETVVLDTAGSPVTTDRLYLGGQTLRITATGTYTYADGVTADAECTSTEEDPPWTYSRASLGNGAGDVVVTDGRFNRTDPSTSTCDTQTHTYAWTWRPTTSGPLTIGVADTDLSDNSGTLTVTLSPAG